MSSIYNQEPEEDVTEHLSLEEEKQQIENEIKEMERQEKLVNAIVEMREYCEDNILFEILCFTDYELWNKLI